MIFDFVNKQANEKLEMFMELVLEENKTMNLTRITDKNEFILKHFYDSFLPTKKISFENKKILDVGSGAGFPGIPLAIMFPSSTFYLLETTTKKCDFLKKTIDKLEIKNVYVLNKRAEDISDEERENFDIVVSRALGNLNMLLELCIPYVKIRGKFIAYKGINYQNEINDAKNAFKLLNCEIREIQKTKLPISNEERFNIIITKTHVCDKKYPREFSQIKKKPL